MTDSSSSFNIAGEAGIFYSFLLNAHSLAGGSCSGSRLGFLPVYGRLLRFMKPARGTLNPAVHALQEISGKQIEPNYGPERPGDVKHSQADISKIKSLLRYEPKIYFKEGLKKVYEWYEKG